MENLKLLEEKPELNPLSKIRQQMILDFFSCYKKVYGRKYNFPFVQCIGVLKGTFEAIDEDTGEILIEYPSREEWNEELKKFFAKTPKNWFFQNGKCTFYLFCKHYGNYDHHIIEPRHEIKSTVQEYTEPPASPDAVKSILSEWKKTIGRE